MKKLSLILTMVLFVAGFAIAQRTITGTVSDAKGEQMVGASVLVKGTTTGAVTDIDGKFSVVVPANATTLVFSFAGYKSQEVALGSANVVDVNLAEALLQELVVTAIGIQREKKALGYSATDLKADELVQRSETDPLRAIAGKVAGVNILGGGGAPGQSTRINIRGVSSFTGNTQPLFVVDGIPFDNSVNSSGQGSQFSNRAFDIDPNNIESMTILKGAAAAALYGSRATNGVVVITTKVGKKSRKGMEVSYNSSFATEQISNLPNYQSKYTQGSSQNYNGGFIGNWGAPFPEYVDEVNAQYYNGEKRYSKTYAAGYPDGMIPHPITGVPYTIARFQGAFPELMEDDPNAPGTTRAKAIPLKSYNFLDQFFQKGLLLENSLTFNGGGENAGISATISRMDNKGIVENMTSSRTSLSVGGNAKLANGLTVSGNVNYVNTGQTAPPVAPSAYTDYFGQGESSIFSRLFYLPRNVDLMGWPFENPVTGDNVFYRALENPRWLIKNNQYTSSVNRGFGSLTLSYDVTPWMSLTAKGGINNYTDNQKFYQRPSTNVSAGLATGGIFQNAYTKTEMDFNYFASLTPKVGKDLDVRVILGVNQNQRSSISQFISGQNLFTSSIDNLTAATTKFGSDYKSLQRLYAVYADATIGYKNFLYLGLTARNDFTSTLVNPYDVKNSKNSYFYPGVSLSFVASDAIKLPDFVSFAKLRASWTQVGNEASPYQTSTTYNFLDPFVTGTGTRVNRATLGNVLGNAGLVNELTTEIEFGTDLRFFKKRVGIDFTWYKRNSTDQITRSELARTSGFGVAIVNAGEIQNKGVELGVTLVPIQTANFKWEANVNFTRNRSLVVDAGAGGEIVVDQGAIKVIHRTGLPLGQLFGSKNARVDNNDLTSPLLINKSTGMPFTLPTDEIIGNPYADFNLGWVNTVSFKGFTLTTLFDWKQGGDIYSITAASLLLRGQLAFQTEREAVRVVPGVYGNTSTFEAIKDDKGNNIKNTTGANAFDTHFSDGFGAYGADEVSVYDGTTFRLREIVLGYELPKKFLKKTPLGSIRLSVSGRNLWFKVPHMLKDLNLDPEVLPYGAAVNVIGVDLGATPTTRRFGVNLYATF
jgi:TonB-linked SusC/RagA family outer membrane protein